MPRGISQQELELDQLVCRQILSSPKTIGSHAMAPGGTHATGSHRLRRPDVVLRPIQSGRLARTPQVQCRVVADDEELLPERSMDSPAGPLRFGHFFVAFLRVWHADRGVAVRLCGCVVVVTVSVSSRPGRGLPPPILPLVSRPDPRARGVRFLPACSRRSLRLSARDRARVDSYAPQLAGALHASRHIRVVPSSCLWFQLACRLITAESARQRHYRLLGCEHKSILNAVSGY